MIMPPKSSKASANKSRIVRAFCLEAFISQKCVRSPTVREGHLRKKPLLTRGLLTLSRNHVLLDINHFGLIAFVFTGAGLFNKFRGRVLMTRLIVVSGF